MTELEQFIRSHADDFDVQEPAPGHQDRFLARVEESQQPARRPMRLIWGAVAVAASLSALFLVNNIRNNSPEAIYLAYMDQVSRLYSDCPADAGTEWDESIASLTEETVPLFLQLPDEMPRAQKARILKEHYASLLEGARNIAKQ